MIWRLIVLSLIIICLTGCSVYRPAPLEQAAVDVALKPPSMEAVRLEAEKIQHPLCKLAHEIELIYLRKSLVLMRKVWEGRGWWFGWW